MGDRDKLNRIVAAYEEEKEAYEKARTKFKEDLLSLKTDLKSLTEKIDWSRKYRIKTLNWELDFYKNREKRRSENRREKRLRKKQRQAAAKGRMDIDANEIDEE